MSVAQETAKQVEKGTGNKREPKLGDRVQHTLSGIRGTITELSTVDTETLISVTTMAGKVLTKLNRREFVLDNSRIIAMSPILEAPYAAPAPKLDGPISTDSILEELV